MDPFKQDVDQRPVVRLITRRGLSWRLVLVSAALAVLVVTGWSRWRAQTQRQDTYRRVQAWAETLRDHQTSLRGVSRRLREDDAIRRSRRELLGLAERVEVGGLEAEAQGAHAWPPGLLPLWMARAREARDALHNLANLDPQHAKAQESFQEAQSRMADLEAAVERVWAASREAWIHQTDRAMSETMWLHSLMLFAASLMGALLAILLGLRLSRRLAKERPAGADDEVGRRYLEETLGQLPQPQLLVDPSSTKIRFANPGACLVLGAQSVHELHGSFLGQRLASEDGTPFQVPVGGPATAIVRVPRAHGMHTDLAVHSAPLRVGGRSLLWISAQPVQASGASEQVRQSQSRFQLLAENIPGATFLMARRGSTWSMAYLSDGIVDLTGLEPDAFNKGRREIEALMHPDDVLGAQAEVEAALADGRPYLTTYRLRHSDGSERWIEERGRAVRREGGPPRHLQGTLFDITRRRRALEALQTEKERLSFTLRSIADGVIGTDAQGRIELMNEAAERVLGRSFATVGGKALTEIWPQQAEGERLPPFARWFSGTASNAQHTVRFPGDGDATNERIVAVAGSPLRGLRGDTLGTVVVLRDVTVQHRREEEMLRAAKLESVGVLAGGIAHDFNNILAGIIGNLSLARMDVDHESDMGYSLKQALDAAVRAQDLTRQLLTFAKGGAPLKRVTVLDRCIRDTVAFALRGSKVSCTPMIQEGLAATDVDENQIHQVLHNLVLNATHAMPDGGPLEVAARNVDAEEGDELPISAGRYVELSVSDSGCGIRPEDRKRIFDPYFTTKEEGTGLGLATSYSIIRKHGGTILVESEVGVGTTFRIYLPASAVQPDTPEDALAALQNARQGTGKILLMDDEPTVRDVGGRMLKGLGYKVTTASDGQQALELYAHALGKKYPYDLVIMDLTVPQGMGGADAAARLRELDPEARVVVSSGNVDAVEVGEPPACAFQGALPKPYTQGELAAMLVEQLGRSRESVPLQPMADIVN